MKLISRARKLNPLNAEFAIELAAQHLMLDEYEKAFNLFQV
jgi:hypothetical protein